MKECYIFVFIAFLSGCSSMGVEPWERDLLAKDSMQLVPDYFDNFQCFFDARRITVRK